MAKTTKKRKDNCFWKSGRWYFLIWVNGRRQTFRGFSDYEATRRMRDELNVQIARQATGLPVQPTIVAPLMTEHLQRLDLVPKIVSRTIHEWAAAYIDSLDAGDKWAAKKKITLLRIINDLGWQTLADIDVEQARGYIKRLTYKQTNGGKVRQSSKSTRRKYATTLRSFGIWLESEEVTPNNPFRRLKLPKVRDEDLVVVRRVLGPDELQRLIDASGERAMLYLTAMGTGLRAEELGTLAVANFDLRNCCIRQRKTKNGKAAVIPIHPSIIEPLRLFLANKPPERLVWPGQWWEEAARMLRGDLKRAGIPYMVAGERYDFHALRHQFNSLLQEAGIEPSTRQKLTRHATLRDVQRYTHVPDRAVVEALAKVQLPALRGRGD